MKPFVIIVATLGLAGCTPEEREIRALNDSAGGRLSVHIDRATGCQYLTISDRTLTPRLGRDGRQICTIKEPA